VKNKILGLAGIAAACAVPAFGSVVVPVPEGGHTSSYLLLAGICCVGAMFLRFRNKTSNREMI
jgi:hypothetical protein